MEKVNGVYVVNAAVVGGGMKNLEKSPHEAKKLNSEVRTYDISTFQKPTPYEVFSTWPDDIQRNYLYNCYWKHKGTTMQIADMFGVTREWVRYMLENHDIPRRRRGYCATQEEKDTWARFLLGGTMLKDILPMDVREKLEAVPDTAEEVPSETDPLPEEQAETEPAETETETKTQTYHVDLDDRFATLAALLTQLKGSGAEVNICIKIDV